MLKRIVFGTRARATGDFEGAWRSAQRAALAAPDGIRPARVDVCLALGEAVPPACDGVALQWFTDDAHLARFQAWLPADLLAHAVDPASVAVVVAREEVMRGQQWLLRRRETTATSFKHMALARRVPGLGQAEFLARWQNRAGSVGTVPIPARARGQAYVQNRPLPAGDWPYDAVNEVYFDDVADLRERVRWFAANLGRNEADLFREPRFVAVREESLTA